MIQDGNNSKQYTLSRIIEFNIAELVENIRQMEALTHDCREIIWTIEDKMREGGINVPERKV